MTTHQSNQNSGQLRKTLSGECVVALDTNILSAFEGEKAPEYYTHFKEMSEAGVRFCIPDLCIGERLECFAHPKPEFLPIMREKWQRVVSRLDSICWGDLPCLPTRGALYDLIDFQEIGVSFCRHNPFSIEVSKKLYSYFHDYEASSFNNSEYRKPFEDELRKERCEWKCFIENIRRESKNKTKDEILSDYLQDANRTFSALTLPSTLLKLPYSFAVERAFDPEYAPCATHCKYRGKRIKPRNDGLDYQILLLTMVSINICSIDDFFCQAREMNLPRSNCCHQPQTIFDNWRKNQLHRVVLADCKNRSDNKRETVSHPPSGLV